MTDDTPTYGNFWYPRTAGLGRMTLNTSLALIAQIVLLLLALMVTGSLITLAIGLLWLGAFAGLVLFPDRHGMTPMEHATERVNFMIRRAKKLNTYQAEENSPPPGVLSDVWISEHRDGHQRVFGLVHYPNHQFSVVLRCHPIGGELHDQEDVNRMVAAWGGYGAAFATTPGIDQIAATVEVGPNYGASAIAAVDAQMDPDANPLARRMNQETMLQGVQEKTAAHNYQSVTFAPVPGKFRTREERAEAEAAAVARRLPGIIERLKRAGSGAVIPCRKEDITEHVRIAYDPTMARTIESARVNGNTMDIGWENAGPVWAVDEAEHYRHGPAYSVTFKMTNAPKSTITSDNMGQLLAPHPDIHRKRVTLIRHIQDSGRAADIAELEYTNAKIRAGAEKGTAAARTDLDIADQIRREISTGSALERFTILITVTVLDVEDIPQAVAAVEDTLAPSARIGTRIMYGQQEVMFAGALALGVDLTRLRPGSMLTKLTK